MKKKLYKYGLLYIGVALAACADNADLNEPTGSTMPPAQVLNATVKNLPGAAIIYYDLPDDQNLKYVRASYKVDNMVRTVNASFYTDSLVVEGFPTKGEYDIELYSVSYGEVVSSPLVVKVNPDTPPYQKVRGTLVSAETFGGIRVNFDNPEKAKLGLGVIKKQAEGIWTQVYMHYTEAKGGDFYVRGLDAVTTDFGIFVRDRWGHLSDTLYVTETPLYEEQCDKSLFRKMALPTDSYECHSWNEVTKGNDMTRLWDGITDADPCFQTKTTTVMPQWFTFDMATLTGERIPLNRLWNRRQCTKFNGTSYITQRAAEAIYTPAGKQQIKENIDYYMNNARTMKEGLEAAGLKVYGGVNAPYIWLKAPNGIGSWRFFEQMLYEANVVGTPGVGFGPSGEGYIRLTAFGNHEDCVEAMRRIRKWLV